MSIVNTSRFFVSRVSCLGYFCCCSSHRHDKLVTRASPPVSATQFLRVCNLDSSSHLLHRMHRSERPCRGFRVNRKCSDPRSTSQDLVSSRCVQSSSRQSRRNRPVRGFGSAALVRGHAAVWHPRNACSSPFCPEFRILSALCGLAPNYDCHLCGQTACFVSVADLPWGGDIPTGAYNTSSLLASWCSWQSDCLPGQRDSIHRFLFRFSCLLPLRLLLELSLYLPKVTPSSISSEWQRSTTRRKK